jgi:hypothetical protein
MSGLDKIEMSDFAANLILSQNRKDSQKIDIVYNEAAERKQLLPSDHTVTVSGCVSLRLGQLKLPRRFYFGVSPQIGGSAPKPPAERKQLLLPPTSSGLGCVLLT